MEALLPRIRDRHEPRGPSDPQPCCRPCAGARDGYTEARTGVAMRKRRSDRFTEFVQHRIQVQARTDAIICLVQWAYYPSLPRLHLRSDVQYSVDPSETVTPGSAV